MQQQNCPKWGKNIFSQIDVLAKHVQTPYQGV